MISNIEALNEAKRYKEIKEKYNYNDSYKELEYSRGRKNYDRIITRLMNIELPSYLELTYTKITIDELKEYLREIMTKILGPDIEKQIIDLCQNIILIKNADYFDSIIRIQDNIPKEILVPKQLYSIEVASTANTFIRHMMTKYEQEHLNRVISNYHYKELLSITIEYIVCYELHKYFKKDKLNEKHDIIRTQAVYISQLEHQGTEDLEKELRSKYKDRYHKLKDYFEFEPHIAYGNAICDIYGNRLFDIYRAGDKKLIELFRGIISGNNSIDELLKYYNISLVDQFTVDSYERKLAFLKEK